MIDCLTTIFKFDLNIPTIVLSALCSYWIAVARHTRQRKNEEIFKIKTAIIAIKRNAQEIIKAADSFKKLKSNPNRGFYPPFLDTYDYFREITPFLEMTNEERENFYMSQAYYRGILHKINEYMEERRNVLREYTRKEFFGKKPSIKGTEFAAIHHGFINTSIECCDLALKAIAIFEPVLEKYIKIRNDIYKPL